MERPPGGGGGAMPTGKVTADSIAALLVAHHVYVHFVNATDTGSFVVFLEQAAGHVDYALALLQQRTRGAKVRRVAPAIIRLDLDR